MAFMASPLNASTDVTPKEQQSGKKLLRPSELSIYDPCHHCHEQRTHSTVTATALERDIARARIAVVSSLEGLADTKDRAVRFYDTGKAHTLDSIAYLREESNVLARVGAIAVGGLTGILFAARRGLFKKLLYGGSGMAAIASLCYPNEAGQVSRSAYTIAKYYAYVAYLKLEGEVRSRSSSSTAYTSPTNKKDEVAHASTNTDKQTKVQGDFGQSHPEDADLYTTRTK